MNYTYDGTFWGFLSLVYYLFEEKDYKASIDRINPNMLFQGKYIETSMNKADKVYQKLLKILGQQKVNKLFSAFLAEENRVEELLFSYIRKAIKVGKEIDTMYLYEVERVERFSMRALHEAHKFKGFIRFRRLKDDTYYAIIEPTHNVLPLLADHFINRFADQKFVIHDTKRKRALMYDNISKNREIVDIKNEVEALINYEEDCELLHEEEKLYISLWRKYFDTVAIEERANPECQRNFMPKKYWKNLVEVNGKVEG